MLSHRLCRSLWTGKQELAKLITVESYQEVGITHRPDVSTTHEIIAAAAADAIISWQDSTAGYFDNTPKDNDIISLFQWEKFVFVQNTNKKNFRKWVTWLLAWIFSTWIVFSFFAAFLWKDEKKAPQWGVPINNVTIKQCHKRNLNTQWGIILCVTCVACVTCNTCVTQLFTSLDCPEFIKLSGARGRSTKSMSKLMSNGNNDRVAFHWQEQTKSLPGLKC